MKDKDTPVKIAYAKNMTFDIAGDMCITLNDKIRTTMS
jgi:hypothetical protein